MSQRDLHRCPHNSSDHQCPDTSHLPRQQYHDQKIDGLRCQLKHRQTLQLHMAIMLRHGRCLESSDQHNQAGDRDHQHQSRFIVEDCHRPGDQACHGPEQNTANHADRPCGAEKLRIISAFVVNDCCVNSNVRQHFQTQQEDVDKGHQAERFGSQ